jgi:phage terminase small subunit
LSEIPAPPRHLRRETRAWWREVATAYELEGHHLKLLTLAAGAWDRCVQSREAIRRHGLVYKDRWGAPKPRPEVSIERDSKIAFARLLRELALDVDPPEESRPPITRGTAALRRVQ